MNKLGWTIGGIFFLCGLIFSAKSVFSNPDKFASTLLEAAFAEDRSASRRILQGCDREDLSDLVSGVIFSGTLREDGYEGKTLPEVFQAAGVDLSGVPTACAHGSVKLVLGSVNSVESSFEFKERDAHTLNVTIHMIPLPSYTALLTFELSGIRAQLGVMINSYDPLIVRLRSFFLSGMPSKCLVFEKNFPLVRPFETAFIDR